jgi:acyl-CoA thioesterase-1
MIDVPVINLAQPSDDADAALRDQVPQLPAQLSSACLIVDIGGNDMLDRASVSRFEAALDRILAPRGAQSVVLLELPVIPGAWRYGMVQRRMAKKHGVFLAPKRILAGVLSDSRNTFDGVHLRQRGHDALARQLSGWLGWSR